MAKAGYNHEKPSGLGKFIPEASRKEGQKTLKAKGVRATSSKARSEERRVGKECRP